MLDQKADTNSEKTPNTASSNGSTNTVNGHKTFSFNNNLSHTGSQELDENNSFNSIKTTSLEFNTKDLLNDPEKGPGRKEASTMDSYLNYMNTRYDNINDISAKELNTANNDINCSYDDINNRAKAKLQIRKQLKQLQQLQLQRQLTQGEQNKDSQNTDKSPSNFNVLSFNDLKDKLNRKPQSTISPSQHQDPSKLTYRSSMQASKTTKAYRSNYYDQKYQQPEYITVKHQRRNRPGTNMPAFHESDRNSKGKIIITKEDSFKQISRSSSSNNHKVQGYDTLAYSDLYRRPGYDVNNKNDNYNADYNVSTLPVTLRDNKTTNKNSNNNTIWINNNVRESYI